jgi:putative ABC transport system substrate-binding protein
VGIVAAPVMGEGQQVGKVWRVGVLTTEPRPAPDSMHGYDAFTDELRELGYGEGQNIIFEWRHTDGNAERRRQEAAAIVGWKPDVILASSGMDAIVFRSLITAQPIVVAAAGDLVSMGLAASVPRPGGNVTGLQILQPELAIKKLQLMRELVPGLQRLAVLHERGSTANLDRIFADVEAAARAFSIQVNRFIVSTPDDFDPTLAAMKARGMQAILVSSSSFTLANADRLVQVIARYRLPDIHDLSANAEAGSLASYGYKRAEMYQRAARYVVRVLKGASPAELPIEQPTQLELVINLKTAKALGLTIPQSVLVRAERVIQ